MAAGVAVTVRRRRRPKMSRSSVTNDLVWRTASTVEVWVRSKVTRLQVPWVSFVKSSRVWIGNVTQEQPQLEELHITKQIWKPIECTCILLQETDLGFSQSPYWNILWILHFEWSVIQVKEVLTSEFNFQIKLTEIQLNSLKSRFQILLLSPYFQISWSQGKWRI